MITNQDILDTASTTFHAMFDKAFAGAPPGVWATFTEKVETESEINEIDILGAMPVIREWKGAKIFRSIRAYSATAKLKSYESSLRIPFKKARYDRTTLVGRKIKQFMGVGGRGSAIYDKICTDALIAVATTTGYDGVAVYSTAHPHGPSGATQSNRSSTAFSFAQHDAVMQAGPAIQDEYGEPFGVAYNQLMVGPKLAKLAMEVTQSKERVVAVANDGLEAGTRVAAASIPNVYGGSALFTGGDMDLIINPRLVGAYDDYYFYFDRNFGTKPVILYEGRAVEPHEQTQMDSEGRFINNELRFSLECDVVGAPGDWHGTFAGIL